MRAISGTMAADYGTFCNPLKTDRHYAGDFMLPTSSIYPRNAYLQSAEDVNTVTVDLRPHYQLFKDACFKEELNNSQEIDIANQIAREQLPDFNEY